MHLSDNEISTFIDNSLKTSDKLSENHNLIDLTYLKSYSIDGPNSEEIDDAISLEIIGDIYKLWIHIADPTIFIPKDSKLDLLAKESSSSVYLSTDNRLMFPSTLLDELFNLKVGTDRFAVSMSITFDQIGNLIDYEIIRSIVKLNYCLTYAEADELIDYRPPEELDLYLISNLLNVNRRRRLDNNAIILEDRHSKFISKNNELEIDFIEFTPSRILISEAMILFGSLIGDHGFKNNIFLPYRSQPDPKLNIENLSNKYPSQTLRNIYIRHHLSKATTDIKPNNHYSLGVKCYVQASSPLRRYSDIIVHRQVFPDKHKQYVYSEEEIHSLITEFNRNTKAIYDLVRQDRRDCITKWFTGKNSNIYETIFIRVLNSKDFVYLFHFIELSMDVAIVIKDLKYLSFGQYVSLLQYKTDSQSQEVHFEVNKYH